ncbi:hypothetical protein [Segniliparus rugosus]|uniref:Uncharacterized protein n=1 Tax=Segniliparus rugosus (strain ATCC BAA-974 / DSM 45345 / CCUG 50838 / CIP 108380 / JCM 13579 / CDC 945) TaxID=679197 RepID=E5XTU9_SEGRC|nr:hypothetical protein [Segniliparus rugosus]EFV12229.1 hypothetical protein HMPREF9336_02921 [Segniliparus rugosus ATCC BAA-974]
MPETTNPLAVGSSVLVEGLGKLAKLALKGLHVSDDWAFVYGDIKEPDGRPIDYAGTRFAEAAANGGKSQRYAVLLQKVGNSWTLVDSAIGPTGLAWQDWSSRYGAPSEIFQL